MDGLAVVAVQPREGKFQGLSCCRFEHQSLDAVALSITGDVVQFLIEARIYS
jgi:hypothetical protein